MRENVICVYQMVPLLKRSTDTLVEKMREFAISGKSMEVFRYNYSLIVRAVSNMLLFVALYLVECMGPSRWRH